MKRVLSVVAVALAVAVLAGHGFAAPSGAVVPGKGSIGGSYVFDQDPNATVISLYGDIGFTKKLGGLANSLIISVPGGYLHLTDLLGKYKLASRGAGSPDVSLLGGLGLLGEGSLSLAYLELGLITSLALTKEASIYGLGLVGWAGGTTLYKIDAGASFKLTPKLSLDGGVLYSSGGWGGGTLFKAGLSYSL